ncbi:MAG: YggT family protein [Chloroflexota bacterium]|nr:YggT family protein [Chloroflexota bacterium]
MCATCFLIVFVGAFVNVLAGALTLSIFARVILSWVQIELPFGLNAFVYNVTEPILGPIRRALPAAAGIDLSPLVALLAIQAVSSILLRLLPPPI